MVCLGILSLQVLVYKWLKWEQQLAESDCIMLMLMFTFVIVMPADKYSCAAQVSQPQSWDHVCCVTMSELQGSCWSDTMSAN